MKGHLLLSTKPPRETGNFLFDERFRTDGDENGGHEKIKHFHMVFDPEGCTSQDEVTITVVQIIHKLLFLRHLDIGDAVKEAL